MNLMTVRNAITTGFHKTRFKVQKNSPEILLVTGIILGAGTLVTACKATLKVDDILSESREKIEKIRDLSEDKERCKENDCSEDDIKKAMAMTYVKTALDVVKVYSPSIILGGMSLMCLISSNNILKRRNAAAMAAFATMKKSFDGYRDRVVARYGEEVDKQLKNAIRTEKVTEEKVDEETGKKKKSSKDVEVTDYDGHSEFSRIFDESNPNWKKDAHYNKMFVQQAERYANDVLRVKGVLFLNEVYSMLGFDRTKEGQTIGWVYRPGDDKFKNFVSFGIYNTNDPKKRDFVNGYERSIILDFNPDGIVWDALN